MLRIAFFYTNMYREGEFTVSLSKVFASFLKAAKSSLDYKCGSSTSIILYDISIFGISLDD